jgi:predicted ferric reductase
MSCNWLAWSALALFGLSFVSASDGLGLDKLLRGYLRQYRIHHRIAMLAVLLVVVHISHEFASLPATDRSMLLDLQDRAMLLAWLAVLLLLALTLAAIVRQHWRRRYWLRLHWLLLPAMLLALAHAWLSTRPALRACLPLFGLPLLPWLLKYLPASWWPHFSGHLVPARVQHLAADVVMLEIDTAVLPQHFRAGQIVQLRFCGVAGASRLWHPFSVASCQREQTLRLLIRQAGLDTGQLATAGSQVDIAIRGPYQEWQADFSRPQLWIAGGIGIAPFIGMWHCHRPQQTQQVQVLHFASQLDRLDYANLLNHCQSQADYHRFDTPAGEMPDLQQLHHYLLQHGCTHPVWLSGPPGFITLVKRYLLQAGIPRQLIHAEQLNP